ncbi:MAG: endonuclease, partial [Clostridia bacterium]|nr:endonuclease [Clostridia bacterium]
MKNKKLLALLLAILLIITSIPSMLVGAATGTVSKNTGVRHSLCTALSSQALDYYADNDALFDDVSALQGGSSNCLTTVNSPLFDELHDLMSTTMTTTVSYDSLTNHWVKTDANGGSSDACLFYSDFVSSSYNREHVWPKSHASFKEKNGGADPHHLRPTNSTINSTRNNYCFTNVRETVSGYKTKENGGNVVLYYGGGYVEVNDNIKGDVARILLYVYCRWEEPNLFMDTPNPVIGPSDDANSGEKVIESLDVLLEWCEIDPVDEWEMGRNDQCENLVGNRNVFIDYPEYAWLLFGEEVPNDMNTPSGEAKGNGTGSTGCAHTTVKYVSVDASTHKLVCVSCSKTTKTEAHTFSDNKCIPCGYEKSTTPEAPTASIKFELGANGSGGHSDGSSKSSYSETVNGYTLNVTNGVSFYTGALDEKGNSCFKVGTSKVTGSFKFTVPDDVTSVVIEAAKYKENASKINVNGTDYSLTKNSNDGEYDLITVDTTTNKTVSIATVASSYRTMINSISFVTAGAGGGGEEEEEPVCQHLNKKYASLDGEKHSVTCSDCGEALGSENHTLVNDKCTLCGYEKPSTPVTPPVASSVTFEFGANGTAAHKDGDDLGSSTTYTEGGYTLKLTSMSKVFGPAFDAKGNSCIKLGSSSTIGKFTFTVPNEVTSVVIKVAKYKANTTKISVNGGAAQAINTASDSGAYTDITVDTSTNKTVTFATVSGGVRAMVNSITFVVDAACNHENTKDTNIKSATYFTSGSKDVVCSDCGEAINKGVVIAASDTALKDYTETFADGKLTIKWTYSDELAIDITNGAVITFNYAIGEHKGNVQVNGT